MPEHDPAIERLVAAHLDDRLAADDARLLHEHLRADPVARRLLIAAARQAAALPRLALERAVPCQAPVPPSVQMKPRRFPRWVLAAGILLAVAAGWRFMVMPSVDGPRLQGVAAVERDGTTVPVRHVVAGDRITTTDGAASLAWTHEDTRLTLEPGSRLMIEELGGTKRLRFERGTLRAEVARQEPDGGFTVITTFGAVEVVGTRFAVQVHERASEVSVERGAVRLVTGTGTPVISLESGYSAIMDGTRIPVPMPQGQLPEATGTAATGSGGMTQVWHFVPADWRGGEGWEGDVVDGAIRGRPFERTVTRILFPRRPEGYLPLGDHLVCTMRLSVDRETTCALLLVCHGPDGVWLRNLQGERRLPRGEQEVSWRLEDLRIAKGTAQAAPPGSRISALALMTWTPAADLRLHRIDLRGSDVAR